MGDPADFGQVVAFLCSEQANFINGIALGVDGGTVTGLLRSRRTGVVGGSRVPGVGFEPTRPEGLGGLSSRHP